MVYSRTVMNRESTGNNVLVYSQQQKKGLWVDEVGCTACSLNTQSNPSTFLRCCFTVELLYCLVFLVPVWAVCSMAVCALLPNPECIRFIRKKKKKKKPSMTHTKNKECNCYNVNMYRYIQRGYFLHAFVHLDIIKDNKRYHNGGHVRSFLVEFLCFVVLLHS